MLHRMLHKHSCNDFDAAVHILWWIFSLYQLPETPIKYYNCAYFIAKMIQSKYNYASQWEGGNENFYREST
jgi:hypothetical protein